MGKTSITLKSMAILMAMVWNFTQPCMAEDNKKEPDKQPTSIELTGNYETQHDRSLLYPVEAWIVNNELEVTFHEPTSNVTLTVIGTSGVVFSQTISFNSFQTETINLYGCPKGIYTLTITTPQGTYLSGMCEIE